MHIPLHLHATFQLHSLFCSQSPLLTSHHCEHQSHGIIV